MTYNKRAIITGVTGQDGMYLSALLLKKGYSVLGITRVGCEPADIFGFRHLGIDRQMELEACDLSDISQIIRIFQRFEPDEVYNLAAQSSVSESFKQPIGTIQFNIISVLNILEAIKIVNPRIKFYQASSSEMYGSVPILPISEKSVLHPVSPYGVSKVSAHWITNNYRDAYGLFATSGVLFNHESFLRKGNFFVKKIISQAIDVKQGERTEIQVGNIDIKRDFGYAPKYVEAMWLMLQQEKPADFLICSGTSISLREIAEHILDCLHLPYSTLVVSDHLIRPTEIEDIYGDNKQAKEVLGWDYNLPFKKVVEMLIEEEITFRESKIGNR